jgi:hypothetical protein
MLSYLLILLLKYYYMASKNGVDDYDVATTMVESIINSEVDFDTMCELYKNNKIPNINIPNINDDQYEIDMIPLAYSYLAFEYVSNMDMKEALDNPKAKEIIDDIFDMDIPGNIEDYISIGTYITIMGKYALCEDYKKVIQMLDIVSIVVNDKDTTDIKIRQLVCKMLHQALQTDIKIRQLVCKMLHQALQIHPELAIEANKYGHINVQEFIDCEDNIKVIEMGSKFTMEEIMNIVADLDFEMPQRPIRGYIYMKAMMGEKLMAKMSLVKVETKEEIEISI